MKHIFSLSSCRRSISIAATAFAIGTAWVGSSYAQNATIAFDLPAENTAQALNDFARQANIQILFPYAAASSFSAPAVHGSYSRDAALSLLLANTNLEVVTETDTTITLRATSKVQGQAATALIGATDEPSTEVIVTGTHIRGANPTSPVHTITRKDIDSSGYSQIGDLMQSLPENFYGGQNPGVRGASKGNNENQNASDASTVNLRGLGTGATLVLLNGHRIAADTFFQGSDISGVPLAAVQRVEVVPDGASALYGSDAVAGVVNIVMRKDYNGGALSARLGGSTQGGGAQTTVNLLQGVARDDWYALFNVESTDSDGITASQRRATSTAVPWNTLINPLTKRSAFLSIGRTLNDHIKLSFDALVGERHAKSVIQPTSSASYATDDTKTPTFNLAAMADFDLSATWKVHLTAGASGSRNTINANIYDSKGGALSDSQLGHYKNGVSYAEVTADGTLFHAPSGDVKTALGAGYRTENIQEGLPSDDDYLKKRRKVSYAYGEIFAPLVTPSASRTGLHALELSLSGRLEDYSDFGKSANPKVGIRYVPINDLAIRGTWSKSFKAPSFDQMYTPNLVYLYPASLLGYSGAGQALYLSGGNPDLGPEKATSWTLGADYSPQSLKSLKVSATYFNIDYNGRVVTPVSSVVQGFSNPLYAPFAQYNPSLSVVNDLVDNASEFFNLRHLVYDPSSVVAILHNNFQNASSQSIRGVDLSIRQSFTLESGDLTVFANATQLKIVQQTISTAPSFQVSGMIFNAPKFKARGGMTWTRGALSASAFADYVASETDTGVNPVKRIGSWTTVDANLAYNFQQSSGAWKNVKFALSASNLFDKIPPRAASPAVQFQGLYFDSNNASIVGRFISLSVSKGW